MSKFKNPYVELFVAIILMAVYLYLVNVGKAQAEGFIVLITYTIKKLMDINDTKQEEQNAQGNSGSGSTVTPDAGKG